jgi:hypothetical protein
VLCTTHSDERVLPDLVMTFTTATKGHLQYVIWNGYEYLRSSWMLWLTRKRSVWEVYAPLCGGVSPRTTSSFFGREVEA